MTEHVRLLQSLFCELSKEGGIADPQGFVNSVDENLREMHQLTEKSQSSRLQQALHAEAGYWLYRIREVAALKLATALSQQ